MPGGRDSGRDHNKLHRCLCMEGKRGAGREGLGEGLR